MLTNYGNFLINHLTYNEEKIKIFTWPGAGESGPGRVKACDEVSGKVSWVRLDLFTT